MKFNWDGFTKETFNKCMEKWEYLDDFVGSVIVGDIVIDLIIKGYDKEISYDFYVAHEDAGYGYKDGIPYAYADGGDIPVHVGMSYEEFKVEAEKEFSNHIKEYKGRINLINHANRELLVW